jgi:cell division protein FtsQ
MATRRQPAAALPMDVRLMNVGAAVLGGVGAAVLCVVLVLWLARQPVFALRSIRIDGDVARNSVSTIRANAAPQLAGNYFSLDLGAARRAFESVPWVRSAVVNRVWPNRLAVRLEEHHAAALWGGDGGAERMVNTHGEVFEANVGDVEDDALPTLRGPDGSSAHLLALLQRLVPEFAPLEASIETLAMTSRGSLRAELDSGAEIELGRGSDEEIVERTRRFVATVTQVTSRYQRPIESADLRHNEGYAVKLKGVGTAIEKNTRN